MTDYVVKPLDANTWDAFARLVERHNGVFGGCWCTWFHTFHADKTFTAEGNRTLKKRLVEEGRAHAALVFDGDEATARSTRPLSTGRPTTGSPASSWTRSTGAKDWRRLPVVVPWI